MDDSFLEKAGFSEYLLWFLGLRKRFKVEGPSMLPLLKPGSTILMKPVKSKKVLKEKMIVIAKHPFNPEKKLIKQIAEIRKDGRLSVIGLNPSNSLDSRSFGVIQPNLVLGVVYSVLKNQ